MYLRASLGTACMFGLTLLPLHSPLGVGGACAAVTAKTTVYSFTGVHFNWAARNFHVYDDIYGRTCATNGIGDWKVSITVTNAIDRRNTGTIDLVVPVRRAGVKTPGAGKYAQLLSLTLVPGRGRRVTVERRAVCCGRQSQTVAATAKKDFCNCPKLPKGQHPKRSPSKAIADFIRGREKFRSHPYNDLGDTKGNCTVGYGHLLHYSACTGAEASMTRDEAESLFRDDLAEKAADLTSRLDVDLNQNQFDALVDLAFNAGVKGPKRKALLAAANSCNDAVLFAEIRKLIYSNGTKLQELVNRREYEIALFQK